ncbi:MAG: DHH family phosphoesterase [Candidatus Methanoperedens sp.]|nr:DHH family phosphoesterase [Candidatus Methanoperedens sp.]MCE8428239.1 DHH family phosphoesterase [Candidatus Methanoperedens sp.]
MQVDESEFSNQLLDYHNILYLCHRNADSDALGSAFALKEAIGGTIGVIGGCDRVASTLARQLNIEYVTDPKDNFDLVVVVDTSTLAQLNGFQLKNYAVIDHHTTTLLNEHALFCLRRNRSSTAEIVIEVLNSMGAPVMRRAAFALIAGIITDTGNFKHARAESFRAMAELMELSGIEYSEVMDVLSSLPQEVSMRIAFLKAAQRIAIERLDDWIIVTSQVSSFGGAAATNLIQIGADVAFVASKDGDLVKVSARARKYAINAGVNLAKLMEEISAQFKGTGGGHEGAAGMDVYGDADDILLRCVEYVKNSFRKKY